MKKTAFSLALSLIMMSVCACSNEEAGTMVPAEEELQLVAPSGVQFAATRAQLQEEASTVAFEKFGTTECTVLSIEYAPLDEGYLALVYFELEDGTLSSYAQTNSLEVMQATKVDELQIKGAKMIPQQPAEDGSVTFMMESTTRVEPVTIGNIKYYCEGSCNNPCQVFFTVVGNKAIVSCDGCDDCRLKAEIQL